MVRFSFVTICAIAALAIAAIAVLAVQNATAVSLQFLSFSSVAVPLGTLMGFAAALGLTAGAIALAATAKRSPLK